MTALREWKFEDHRRIGSKAPQNVGDGAIQAGDDGSYANNGSGADDHSQHRQEGAHLVFAHGVQREADRRA